MRLTLLMAAVLLAGCDIAPKVTPVISGCPPIVQYSPEFQKAAAAELRDMQDANHHSRYPHVSRMILDYGTERDALRECQ